MHNSWGSYPIFYKTLILWSILSVCWWTASRFFLVLCAIMKLCRELGLFGTILSFGSLISFFLYVFMDISFLDVSFIWYPPSDDLSIWYPFHLVSVRDSLEHAYLLHVFSLACFLSLTQYIGETPPSLKLDEMCMKFIFISICTYLCGVCPMYCWFSNSLVPMSLGTILFVLLF